RWRRPQSHPQRSHVHGAHVHAGHGHAAHGHAGNAHAAHDDAGHAVPTDAPHTPAGGRTGGMAESLLSLMSPRLLFSVCLGLGTTGLVLRQMLGGPFLFAAALVGGILFERVLVTPIWNFAFRFESAPALTLEHTMGSEAKAVTTFDADGQGLIAVD